MLMLIFGLSLTLFDTVVGVAAIAGGQVGNGLMLLGAGVVVGTLSTAVYRKEKLSKNL